MAHERSQRQLNRMLRRWRLRLRETNEGLGEDTKQFCEIVDVSREKVRCFRETCGFESSRSLRILKDTKDAERRVCRFPDESERIQTNFLLLLLRVLVASRFFRGDTYQLNELCSVN